MPNSTKTKNAAARQSSGLSSTPKKQGKQSSPKGKSPTPKAANISPSVSSTKRRKKKISPPASPDEGTPPVGLDAILADKDPHFPPVDEPPLPLNSLPTLGALILPTPDPTNDSTPVVPLAQNEDSDCPRPQNLYIRQGRATSSANCVPGQSGLSVGGRGGQGGSGGAARSDAPGDPSVSLQTTEHAANTSTGVLAWTTTALFNLQMEFVEASDRALLVKEKC